MLGITPSTCYPTAFWRPAGGFIDAEYDDYGRVTLADTPPNRQRLGSFFRYVLRNVATVPVGENEYHDLAFDFPKFLATEVPEIAAKLQLDQQKATAVFGPDVLFQQCVVCWDYIWEVASKHRLFGMDVGQKLRPLEFAVMHKSVHDALVLQTEQTADWHGVSLNRRTYFDQALASALKELQPQDSDTLLNLSDFRFVSEFRQALQSVGGFEGSRYPGEGEVYVTHGIRYAKGELTADQFFEAIQPYMDARYVMAALGELNLTLTPMVYAGQDYSNEVGRAYAKFIRNASAVVSKARRDKYRE